MRTVFASLLFIAPLSVFADAVDSFEVLINPSQERTVIASLSPISAKVCKTGDMDGNLRIWTGRGDGDTFDILLTDSNCVFVRTHRAVLQLSTGASAAGTFTVTIHSD